MTNKVVLRTTEEFMADYKPIYQPLYPLFLGNSVSYAEEVGKVDFKRLEAVGDIRNRAFTPKDSHIHQIASKEGTKTFKKYVNASQYRQSTFQDRKGLEDVASQVLDEHQKHMDELFCFGEGTQDSDVVNDGLFYNAQTNHVTESSVAMGDAEELYTRVMNKVADADLIAGRKAVLFYGSAVLSLVNGLMSDFPRPLKAVLAEGLAGKGYQIAEVPAPLGTIANQSGFIIANLDQVKLHYMALPSLKAQGINDENMYAWFNFLMGSSMLEVLVSGAVIKQPKT